MTHENFDYIDTFELMALLHTSQRTIQRLRSKGILHAHRLPTSRKNFFSRNEVESLLRNNILDPTGTIDTTAIEIMKKRKASTDIED